MEGTAMMRRDVRELLELIDSVEVSVTDLELYGDVLSRLNQKDRSLVGLRALLVATHDPDYTQPDWGNLNLAGAIKETLDSKARLEAYRDEIAERLGGPEEAQRLHLDFLKSLGAEITELHVGDGDDDEPQQQEQIEEGDRDEP